MIPERIILTEKEYSPEEMASWKVEGKGDQRYLASISKPEPSLLSKVWSTVTKEQKKQVSEVAQEMDHKVQVLIQELPKIKDDANRQVTMRKLIILKKNLFNHMLLLEKLEIKYGQHDQVIKQINTTLGLETPDSPRAMESFNQLLSNTMIALEMGTVINKNWLQNALPEYENLLNKLSPEKSKSLQQMLFSMLNTKFLEHEYHRLNAGKQPVPRMMKNILSIMGAQPKEIEVLHQAAIDRVIKKIEDLVLVEHSKNLEERGALSPKKLDKILQEEYQTYLISEIGKHPQLKNHLPIVSRLFGSLQRSHFISEDVEVKMKQELNKRAQESWQSSLAWPAISGLLTRFKIQFTAEDYLEMLIKNPSLHSQVLNGRILNPGGMISPDPKVSDEAIEDFLTVIDYATKTFPKSLEETAKKQMQHFYQEIPAKVMIAWMKRNAEQTCFLFNQVQWGSSYCLGKGVCNAINLRWMATLIKDNPLKIKNVEDLYKESKEVLAFRKEIEKSPLFMKVRHKEVQEKYTPDRSAGVRAEERKLQAEIKIIGKLDQGQLGKAMVPENILGRFGLTHNPVAPVAPAENVGKLIENVMALNKENNFLGLSEGVVGIYLSYAEGAHAIGMQIEPLRNRFRFWDPNLGLFEYRDFDQFKKEFTEIMALFYPNFNFYRMDQFMQR